jgi:uncharacterized membrane protein (DUF106 family)
VLVVSVGAHGLLVVILLPVLVKILFSVPLLLSAAVVAVVKTMLQQAVVQEAEVEVEPTSLLSKMLGLEQWVKAIAAQ